MPLPSTRRSNAEAVTRHRGPLRRLLDMRGFVPGYGVPHTDVTIRTRDRIALAGSYLHGPGEPAATPGVLLLHGFGGHRRKPAYALLAEELSAVGGVLSLDVRGHGHSGGESTLGLAETLDVAAGAAWLRRYGHGWIAVIGVSMGATAVLRSAGTMPTGAYDAVCTISAVSRWGLRDSEAMRQLTKAVTLTAYRRVYRALLGVRIAVRAWPDATDKAHWPLQPIDAVGRLAPTPLLLVHGVDDHYFGPEQALALHGAAGEPVTLWLEPEGFGHAEDGFVPAFAQRLADAVAAVHATGVWPEAPPLRTDPARSAPGRAAAGRTSTDPAPRGRPAA